MPLRIFIPLLVAILIIDIVLIALKDVMTGSSEEVKSIRLLYLTTAIIHIIFVIHISFVGVVK